MAAVVVRRLIRPPWEDHCLDLPSWFELSGESVNLIVLVPKAPPDLSGVPETRLPEEAASRQGSTALYGVRCLLGTFALEQEKSLFPARGARAPLRRALARKT